MDEGEGGNGGTECVERKSEDNRGGGIMEDLIASFDGLRLPPFGGYMLRIDLWMDGKQVEGERTVQGWADLCSVQFAIHCRGRPTAVL